MSAVDVGCLYLTAFAQAVAPHIGLLVPTSESAGKLVHIRIDRNASPNWTFQCRDQKIEGDMFMTSLLKIGGLIAWGTLSEVAQTVVVPPNDRFGECSPWVKSLIDKLNELGFIGVANVDGLMKEFKEFAAGNRAFARRDKYPNVAISRYFVPSMDNRYDSELNLTTHA
ncbi:hypothetical protein E1B28_006716 [Marasmius oreades]|uniref:Uncharacterized protein n=1 Tax=Marasmius oreades TaxID=181124 RepID=A0A9P7UWS2_9AGAR|nr:uncharacterized protein E1B28_006716 [Marasmius oreades]KAG7096035.1 hypothetical protein E1B28_006716 [Marasmius oreades]